MAMAMASEVEVEAVDFDLDEDDLMDEDASAITSNLRSTVARKTKGRGFLAGSDAGRRFEGRDGYESLRFDGGPGPQRSIEGWIVLVSGLYEETPEDEVYNAFREFGQVKNLHLNLDRQTGYVKGYALIEYKRKEEAVAAIQGLNESSLLDRIISVDWAFCNGSFRQRNTRR